MDIRERLEAGHTTVLTNSITNYVGNDKKRFKVLMDIFMEGDYRLTQRAAWPIGHILSEHPELLKPHFEKIIRKLNDDTAHPAAARNIYRVLQDFEIPEKYQGLLVDRAFKDILSETKPRAIRAFAITTAAQICKHYPELKNELLIVLKELGSLPQHASLKVRIKKALKELTV